MSQEAEESYEKICEISDEIDISVLAIIQYLQWRMIESMEGWDTLGDDQCEALIKACNERIGRTYIGEWRLIYMTNRAIKSLGFYGDTSRLRVIFQEAREEGVPKVDILKRMHQILTPPSDTETEKRKIYRDMFLEYLRENCIVLYH